MASLEHYTRAYGAKTVRSLPVPRFCPNPECSGLARDGVVAEFVDRVHECLDCGSPTLPGDGRISGSPEPPEVEYHELETVFVASDLAQGQLVASTIEAEGIPVYVKGEFLQGALGELPATVSQVEIQVPIERAEAAREIARRWEGPFRERAQEEDAGAVGGAVAGEVPGAVDGVGMVERVVEGAVAAAIQTVGEAEADPDPED